MPRVQLHLPDILPFETDLEIRIADVNYGGHVGHDRVLSLAQEARARLFAAIGGRETDLFGCKIVVADVAAIYTAEGFAGDHLRFCIGLGDMARVAFDLYYRASRIADGVQVAALKTGIVCLHPTRGRPVTIPAALASRLRALLQHPSAIA